MSRLLGGNETSVVDQVKSVSMENTEEEDFVAKGDFSSVVSTGSTLLDLAISGTRIRGGGVPSAILMEIFGPSGHGKTTIMSEIGASAQARGGFFLLGDAERRINKEYARIMGIKITNKNYRQPNTVKECENLILNTPQTGNGVIDVTGIDSIAVLLSELDQADTGDKRGSARAKELHQMVRKAKVEISKETRLVVFTNQIQDVQNDTGMIFGPKEKTPGGNAVPFMASLRMRIGPAPGSKLNKEIVVAGKKIKQPMGIISRCSIVKSTVDKPYREADVYIVFDYGIDDIRANLQFYKTYTGASQYVLGDEKLGGAMEDAIANVERNDLEYDLREAVIDLWEEIQEQFVEPRKPKARI